MPLNKRGSKALVLLLVVGGITCTPWTVSSAEARVASESAKTWNAVQDGSFEQGTPNPYWEEGSINYSTIISAYPYYAHTGTYSCWFGGNPVYDEQSYVRQSIELGNNSAILVFWVRIGQYSGNSLDNLRVKIDGQEIFGVWESEHAEYSSYQRIEVNISQHADGGSHTLSFECSVRGVGIPKRTPNGSTFHVDDVQVMTSDAPLFATFSWSPQYPLAATQVQFTDESSGYPTTWHWSFGDGATGSLPNPKYAYAEAGSYTVQLEVTNSNEDYSSMIKTIEIFRRVVAGMAWQPASPAAGTEVAFSDQSSGDPDTWSWSFGDGATSSEQNPVHTYTQAGSYQVSLTASSVADSDTVQRTITIGAAPLELDFTVSNPQPDIGELVSFTITGAGSVDRAAWDFGGAGCNLQRSYVCSGKAAGSSAGCLSASYRFAAAGRDTVSLSVQVGNDAYGPFNHIVEVSTEGRCPGAPEAAMSWFPLAIKPGMVVRFVDRTAHSPGAGAAFLWRFGDHVVSTAQHPTHVYQQAGEYQVKLTVENAYGSDTTSETLTVRAGSVRCGDGLCDTGESWFSCPNDCSLPAGTTGRAGAADMLLYVPVVVGGVEGVADTFWLTEGMLYNTAETTGLCILGFNPESAPGTVRWSRPVFVPGEQTMYYENLVLGLFGTTESGSLWLHCNRPVMLDTRTYNQTSNGTYGQEVRAIPSRNFIGEGDGIFYLIGLSENDRFRSNIIVQEVSGEPAQVFLRAWRGDGSTLGQRSFTVAANGKRQRRLLDIGFSNLSNGYLTLGVNGAGKVVAIASVVDQITGDAFTVDAVHKYQVLSPVAKETATAGEEHFLVAVVARAPGLNSTLWRSSVSIQNPADQTQNLLLEYRPGGTPLTSAVQLGPGELFHSEDLIAEHFPTAGDSSGSLHVYADDGLVVDSRTYNELPDGGTMGQSLPGLASGDMARFGETWVLNKLKSNDSYRCNLGFAEYAGKNTEVTIVLFDMSGGARRFLSSKTYSVKAFGNKQVTKVFSDMGLSAQYDEAMAYVALTADGGALYVYASVIDNIKGDGATVLAKRK